MKILLKEIRKRKEFIPSADGNNYRIVVKVLGRIEKGGGIHDFP